MSTTFDIRRWATQAGIQTTGGFAVIAECVTMDELQRFAEIAIASAGGVQALSAAPEAFLKGVIALCSNRGYSPTNIESWDKNDKWIADLWRQAEAMLATSPTPPAEQQAAPKAAPQQEAQEPAFWMNEKGHTWSHSDWKQFPKHRAKYPIPLYPHFPAPQPAPAPLSEREAFEAWFRSEYHSRLDRNMPDKSYNDPIAHTMWAAWKACVALAAQGGK